MGIQNFWDLVEPSGRNVSIECMRGKRLAVDISIWLHQIIHAMRTTTGETIPNAHIYIVIFRLCKLIFYGIKPVIVFDGDAPALKKQTLKRRKEKAERARTKMNEIKQDMILTDLVEKIKSGVYTFRFNQSQNLDSAEVKENVESVDDQEFEGEGEDEKEGIEEQEAKLSNLYNITSSDREIIYVDLPYKSIC